MSLLIALVGTVFLTSTVETHAMEIVKERHKANHLFNVNVQLVMKQGWVVDQVSLKKVVEAFTAQFKINQYDTVKGVNRQLIPTLLRKENFLSSLLNLKVKIHNQNTNEDREVNLIQAAAIMVGEFGNGDSFYLPNTQKAENAVLFYFQGTLGDFKPLTIYGLISALTKYADEFDSNGMISQVLLESLQEMNEQFKEKSALDEFNALTPQDFFQKSFNNACALYSTLWAIHQTPDLKKVLMENISKEGGNYHIKNPITGTVTVISPADIEDEVAKFSELHPSKNSLVRAIGIYLNKFNQTEGWGKQGGQFYLYSFFNDFRDLLFGKKFIGPQDPNKKIKLKADGSIVIKNEKGIEQLITGNFIISANFRGHAVAFYFDKSHNQWMRFDNQDSSSPKVVSSEYIPNSQNANEILIIGLFNASAI